MVLFQWILHRNRLLRAFCEHPAQNFAWASWSGPDWPGRTLRSLLSSVKDKPSYARVGPRVAIFSPNWDKVVFAQSTSACFTEDTCINSLEIILHIFSQFFSLKSYYSFETSESQLKNLTGLEGLQLTEGKIFWHFFSNIIFATPGTSHLQSINQAQLNTWKFFRQININLTATACVRKQIMRAFFSWNWDPKTKKPLDGATTAVYSFKIDMQKIPLSGFGGAVIGRWQAAPPPSIA